jgi:rhodanese-related sulfurtransferase
MALYDSARPHPAGFRDVLSEEVSLPAKGYRLIDVREPHDYTGPLGHIPGAELVPLGTVIAQAAEWKKDDEYLFICKVGGRSANAAAALSRMGFTKTMNLVGGMVAWNAAGKTIEK